MLQGIVDFLTGRSAEADALRRHCLFLIVPMLNPDGVICGNYRCSLAAVDLNRRWASMPCHHTVHCSAHGSHSALQRPCLTQCTSSIRIIRAFVLSCLAARCTACATCIVCARAPRNVSLYARSLHWMSCRWARPSAKLHPTVQRALLKKHRSLFPFHALLTILSA